MKSPFENPSGEGNEERDRFFGMTREQIAALPGEVREALKSVRRLGRYVELTKMEEEAAVAYGFESEEVRKIAAKKRALGTEAEIKKAAEEAGKLLRERTPPPSSGGGGGPGAGPKEADED